MQGGGKSTNVDAHGCLLLRPVDEASRRCAQECHIFVCRRSVNEYTRAIEIAM